MKILHVLSSPNYSGAESVACEIIDNYKEDADIAYAAPNGMIEKILNERDIEFLPIKRMNTSNLKKVVKDYKPDVIHAHDFRASVLSAFLFLKIPIISHIHNNSPILKSYNPYSLIYLIATKRINEIIGVSNSIKEEYVFKKFIEKKFTVFPNPVYTNLVKNKSELFEVKKSYDLIYLGRLAEEKSPLRFLKIINMLIETKSDVKAAMVGDGDLMNACQEEIQRLQISKNVEILGLKENPYPYLLSSKILVMPSKWEGFGLAAIEAMILGKPVVASKVGGLVEFIDNSNGKLCVTDEEFLEEINHLLENKEYYQKKSNGAELRAKNLDNGSKYKKLVDSLYATYIKN